MKKLTVCLLNDSFPPIIDGVANAVLNYALNIEKDWGHAMVAVPSYPNADDSRFPFPVFRYPSIDTRDSTSGYMTGVPFSPEVTARLTQQRVDIIHAHCPMTSALLGRALHKRLQAPAIMTYHTKYDIDIANVVQSKALLQTGINSVVTNVSSYDEVWVVSKGAGENLRSLGYQGDYIVMPNGVDFDRRRATDAEVAGATKGYDLPAGVPVFLFIGRMMWYKGIKIILDALKELDKKGIDFRMVFIGTGTDETAIRTYTKAKGLYRKVFFTGSIADREAIRAWYTRADLFLFPSTFDSNGLVVREAAACNLASVLVRDSCAAEGITDLHNAYLIEENARSLSMLLQKALMDPARMRQIGEHAGDELYLSWENAVVHAVERYNIVLELHKSGAFKSKPSFSDNLLATQGDMMYTLAKIGNALNLRKKDGEIRTVRMKSKPKIKEKRAHRKPRKE